MERKLILQAQAGDKEAFDAIVRGYNRRVYRAAYSFMRNIDDAADVAQEVFIRAYKHIERFQIGRALYPWLYRITRNLCLNKLKAKDYRSAGLPDDDLLAARERSPEGETLRNERAAEVRIAVAELPDRFKQIIELKHYQECSYAEMAEILDIPIGTVMSRLYNARVKLREALLEEETAQ